ncbi:MAG TPA: TMEM165/GDT1 family protein [Xanthomonadaceae bacterium]|nr:TMEM165/GDT1 family protein [Xanthomonadaceae bacterium]
MEALLVSTAAVFIAEIGDKTQLLSLLLAARFRRPLTICAGIFVATVLNHALAAWLGVLAAAWLSPEVMRWAVGLSFLAVAAWTLKPDRLDDDPTRSYSLRSVFLISTLAFFLAEMGDKTQVATVVLAAHYEALLAVIAGTTLGMLAANVPVVYLGQAFARRLPLKAIRIAAAVLFAALGAYALLP